MQLLRQGAEKYSRLLDIYPFRTQMISASLIWFTGDIFCQRIIERHEIDWKRVTILTTYGFFFAGPIYCWWYSLLDKRTVHLLKHSKMRYVGTKVLVDQCVFEPPYLCLFFATTSLMHGLSGSEIIHKVKKEVPSTYLVDCLIWPAAQFLNFRFVHVMYQALVVNSICVVWNAFLSYMAHRTHHKSVFTSENDSHQIQK